jgi:proline dehydrogenase
MGLLASLIRSMLPLVPRPIVERVAARYVAGSKLDDALRVVRALNREGICATVDILGESVEDEGLARQAVDEYIELIDAIKSSGVDSSVSVKPTMIGLSISEALFDKHMQILGRRAEERGVVLTIDMEDHATTDVTLHVFQHLRQDFEKIGCVLQAYLRRTLDDIVQLPQSSNVRLCKGIYVEPKEIAYKGYQEVRDNYVAALEYLFIDKHYACIATHDEWLIERALGLLKHHTVASNCYEFQMLLGVKPALGRKLVADGHALRVYVPYGRDWYAYSLRRLRENPQVAVHVLRAMLTGR